jgi:hypothetical protein
LWLVASVGTQPRVGFPVSRGQPDIEKISTNPAASKTASRQQQLHYRNVVELFSGRKLGLDFVDHIENFGIKHVPPDACECGSSATQLECGLLRPFVWNGFNDKLVAISLSWINRSWTVSLAICSCELNDRDDILTGSFVNREKLFQGGRRSYEQVVWERYAKRLITDEVSSEANGVSESARLCLRNNANHARHSCATGSGPDRFSEILLSRRGNNKDLFHPTRRALFHYPQYDWDPADMKELLCGAMCKG